MTNPFSCPIANPGILRFPYSSPAGPTPVYTSSGPSRAGSSSTSNPGYWGPGSSAAAPGAGSWSPLPSNTGMMCVGCSVSSGYGPHPTAGASSSSSSGPTDTTSPKADTAGGTGTTGTAGTTGATGTTGGGGPTGTSNSGNSGTSDSSLGTS